VTTPTHRDIAANAAGFVVFAVGALAANLLIARVYGPAITGLFNQVLAFYIVASQFAVLGTHLAALRQASLTDIDHDGEASALVGTALIAVAVPAVTVMIMGYAASLAVPYLFTTEGLAEALRLALPGLFFFALNKVLINLATGFHLFRVFAIAQAGRSVLFLGACGIWVAARWSGHTITLALTVAEAALSCSLLVPLLARKGVRLPSDLSGRVASLVSFGIKAAPSVGFGDLNSRVDVLVLGLFASAEAIGVYTIAAWLIEGAIQLPVAVRPLVSPALARDAVTNSSNIRLLMRRVGWGTAGAMAGLLTAICLVYPIGSRIILVDPRYQAAQLPLIILSIGVTIASYYLPFDLLLAQSGRPLAHTGFKGSVMLTNLALAFVLVPRLEATGAALAYGVSFVVYAILLQILARRTFRARALSSGDC
jgi:O-antigen/teichoic acid export membrane protein